MFVFLKTIITNLKPSELSSVQCHLFHSLLIGLMGTEQMNYYALLVEGIYILLSYSISVETMQRAQYDFLY